jgi:uncharacterized membrane protein
MTEPVADDPGRGPPPLPDSEYRHMADVLRTGLLVALVLMLGALVTYLALHPGATFGAALGSNPLPGLLALGPFASALLAGRPEAYLTLGVLVLIATPAARVFTGFLYFRRGGERALSAITLTVLALVVVGVIVLGPLVR